MSNVVWHDGDVAPEARWAITGGPGATLWLTGLSASGKSTIAMAVERALIGSGRATYVLDGDNLRLGLNGDLGFSASERAENVRRVGEVALLLADAGVVAVAPLISPYRQDRVLVAERHAVRGVPFFEVFIDTSLEACEARDPKGLYAKARRGEITGFTGVDAPYEPPRDPALRIDTELVSPAEAVTQILRLVGVSPT